MTRAEKRLKAVNQRLNEYASEIDEIYKAQEKEDRDTTEDERGAIDEKLKAIHTLKQEKADAEDELKVENEVKDLSKSMGPADDVSAPRVKAGGDREDRIIKSIGEMFTESPEFQALAEAYKSTGRMPQNTSTGPVMLTKGTMLEGSQVTPGTGGALAAPVPQVIPGVVETLFQKLTFADLILSGSTGANGLRYIVEGTALSGAGGVAEAGAKPESTLALSMRDEPVKKIATMLPISDEMIEDAPAVQSYINGRLTTFVRNEEERQLFRGTSGGNEVQGILTSRSVPVYAGGTAVGNRAVQLFKAMNGLRGSAFVEPDWIILHPTDWEAIRLLTDTAGQFFGGGPFQGPYGSGSNLGASGQVAGAQDTIWSKPVYVTAAIGNAGTALVGTREGAQVFRRGGLSVEATNSHSTYFANNLIAIRAEERLALCVYRPSAFVQVNLA